MGQLRTDRLDGSLQQAVSAGLPGVVAAVTIDGETVQDRRSSVHLTTPDGLTKWGLSFLVNPTTTPEGRPAGSLAWAGLANSYYWIDPVHRVCGVWATQLLPFFAAPAIDGFRRFETEVYDSLSAA